MDRISKSIHQSHGSAIDLSLHLLGIEPELVEYRRLEIGNVCALLDRSVTDFIRASIDHTTANATAGQP